MCCKLPANDSLNNAGLCIDVYTEVGSCVVWLSVFLFFYFESVIFTSGYSQREDRLLQLIWNCSYLYCRSKN